MKEEKRDTAVNATAQSTDGFVDASAPIPAEDERIAEVAARILKKYRVAFEELAK